MRIRVCRIGIAKARHTFIVFHRQYQRSVAIEENLSLIRLQFFFFCVHFISDMLQPSGDDDETARLCQRALYVEPLNYSVDSDKFPSDGHEYIHKVRLETEQIFPGYRVFYECIPGLETSESDDEEGTDKEKFLSLSEWKKKECVFFSRLAGQLKFKRKELMEKFPSRQKFPHSEKEKDICLFCLGSDLYQKIYNSDEIDEAPGHHPLLSVVLHIRQGDIFIIIKYMSTWVMQTDFDHTVCKWIYALLACLHKPISDECEEFLESFYECIDARKRYCDESQKYQIHLLSFILENYFCVKAYSLGPSLDSFIPE